MNTDGRGFKAISQVSRKGAKAQSQGNQACVAVAWRSHPTDEVTDDLFRGMPTACHGHPPPRATRLFLGHSGLIVYY
jgi:hypothetical protein